MKKIIGRIEKVDFPIFELSNIDAKIDTGAYTSSIHCKKVQEVIINDEKHLQFVLLDKRNSAFNGQMITVKDYKVKTVKSSNGIKEDRFAIQTKIKVFNKIYSIELTLSNRKKMKNPILLGRKFLNKKFIVDTELSYTSNQKK